MPRATTGLTDGAPQRSDAGNWPWDVGVAEGGLTGDPLTHSPLLHALLFC